uniref:Uncharacterized protein n=1 Tax=Magallana gigas TaxID=29159 RepID=K1QNI4_MAGGI
MDAKKRSHADSTCDSHLLQDDVTENQTSSVTNDYFPSNTTDWKRCHIEKLGIKPLYRYCAMDVVYEWGLYKLLRKDVVSEELNAVEKIINICNSISTDFSSFEELQTQFTRNHDISNLFIPTKSIPEGLGLCSCRFEEFQQQLELLLWDRRPSYQISPSCFQTLFQDLLSIFGIVSRRQPDIAAKKTRVKGRDISSAPDVAKSRKCSDLDGIPDSKKSRQDESPGRDKCISDCFAQHTGDLLAFSERSLSHMDICGRAGRDILGFIVENTHVTVTHLQISRLSLERIQNSTGEGPFVVYINVLCLYYTSMYCVCIIHQCIVFVLYINVSCLYYTSMYRVCIIHQCIVFVLYINVLCLYYTTMYPNCIIHQCIVFVLYINVSCLYYTSMYHVCIIQQCILIVLYINVS